MDRSHRKNPELRHVFRAECASTLDDIGGLQAVSDLIRGKATRLDPQTGELVMVEIPETQEVAFQKLRLDAIKWLAGYAHGTAPTMDKLVEAADPDVPALTAQEARDRLPQVLRNLGIDSVEKFRALMADDDVKMIVGTKE